MKCHDPQTFANPECPTCWAGTFGAWVTSNRGDSSRKTSLLMRLIADGLSPDIATHIGEGWEPDFFEILDDLPLQYIAALNDAMEVDWWTTEDARRAREQDGVDDSGDEAEAPSPHAALSASLTEAESSASLLPCSYCGAVTNQPCRQDCSGRYRA